MFPGPPSSPCTVPRYLLYLPTLSMYVVHISNLWQRKAKVTLTCEYCKLLHTVRETHRAGFCVAVPTNCGRKDGRFSQCQLFGSHFTTAQVSKGCRGPATELLCSINGVLPRHGQPMQWKQIHRGTVCISCDDGVVYHYNIGRSLDNLGNEASRTGSFYMRLS